MDFLFQYSLLITLDFCHLVYYWLSGYKSMSIILLNEKVPIAWN